MNATQYTVLVDYRDGENDSMTFTSKDDAIRCAKDECRWELTIRATVIAETENGETEIYSQAGSFA